MIKVSNDIVVREIDGWEVSGIPATVITVSSHWSRNSLVVLEIDGRRLSVAASDLRAAIANATNSGSHQ